MHNLGTDCKFPAKISWWLIINVSIRFICLQNYFLDQQHVNLAPQADFHELAAFLPLDQEAGTLDDNMHSACTWFFHHVHLDWNLPNLGRISWISRKTDRKNAWAFFCHYFLHAPEWSWLRAMCMAMQIFSSVPLNYGCQRTIEKLS